MDSRRQHRTPDLRKVRRKTREASNRFADDDLRLENEQLRELNRDLEVRFALLSHEFRTPLQAVFGYTELLDAEIHGALNESQRLYVHRIRQSQHQMLGLIDTILEFARPKRGQQIDVSDPLPQRH